MSELDLITPVSTDDEEYLRVVEDVTHALINHAPIPIIHLVRIDNWFSHRWYLFHGKVLGAFGVKARSDRAPLPIPPFHPHRVVSEMEFEQSPHGWSAIETPARYHGYRSSEENMRLYLEEPGLSIWFSSRTKSTGSGAVMAHLIGPDAAVAWYVGYRREGAWRPVLFRGTCREEYEALVKRVKTLPESSA